MDYVNRVGRFQLTRSSIFLVKGARDSSADDSALLRSARRRSRPSWPKLRPAWLNEHLEHEDGEAVFRHACKLGLEGIVSKRKGSPYRSGRSPDWLKMKNPACEAVRWEAEEDWGNFATRLD